MEQETEATGVVEVKKRKCCQDEGQATLREASGPPSKMRSGERLPGMEGGHGVLDKSSFSGEERMEPTCRE